MQVIVPLRRENHVILSVIGVHLGRPALFPCPAKVGKRKNRLALGRPCVQVLSLPHGKARSARAVEIICIIGVQDKRVCRLVGQVVLVVIARQIPTVFDLDKPVARLRIACVRRICRRLCAAPCRQKHCGKQNRCPRPSEKSHIVLQKFCWIYFTIQRQNAQALLPDLRMRGKIKYTFRKKRVHDGLSHAGHGRLRAA